MISWVEMLATLFPILLVSAIVHMWDYVGRAHIIGVLFLATYAFWIVSVALPAPALGLSGAGGANGQSALSFNLIPIRTLLDVVPNQSPGEIIREHGGNLVLLAPFTALAPALWCGLRSWKWALVIGIAGSGTIELLQLAISALVGYGYRTADIDDLILNTAGALLGYALFRGVYGYQGRRRA